MRIEIPPTPHRLIAEHALDETGSLVVARARIGLEAFYRLAGRLSGAPFVKAVLDKERGELHFLHHERHAFHADYIAKHLLGISKEEMAGQLDAFHDRVYRERDRRFYLGTLCLEQASQKDFLTLELADCDEMDAENVALFHDAVRARLDENLSLYFKPVSHAQEQLLAGLDAARVPRVYLHDLFASAKFIPLNFGFARGRLRFFDSEDRYRRAQHTLQWHDVIVMDRVPESLPRLLGIIHNEQVTPLSHTNILASGWQIPNAVQIGIADRVRAEALDGQWVEYAVQPNAREIFLKRIERPADTDRGPAWSVTKIRLEPPETRTLPIVPLGALRMSHKYKYGTKAANLGELQHLLLHGSERLLGYYRLRRPSRPHLLAALAKFLGTPESGDLSCASWQFLRELLRVPRGIALPFSALREFLESSPKIQQTIGKLKMALEMDARQIDPLAVALRQRIHETPLPDRLRSEIERAIESYLPQASVFAVRSSSNAEDLDGFSAAGLYESVNQVASTEQLMESIKRVWASLVSPRSIRLRHEVGISLEDSYMGVVLQEEASGTLGGVLVTTNPMNRADFRDVYFNLAPNSAATVVRGIEQPYQCLYNTVEGGGRTLSRGEMKGDLSAEQKAFLGRLAFAGRLLQSHFSPDYTFSRPLDIEWIARGETAHLLQIRPYAC